MTVFAAITVGLRFYARTFIIRATGTDDWLILAALVGALSPPKSDNESVF
jgi:hypothetical protein